MVLHIIVDFTILLKIKKNKEFEYLSYMSAYDSYFRDNWSFNHDMRYYHDIDLSCKKGLHEQL